LPTTAALPEHVKTQGRRSGSPVRSGRCRAVPGERFLDVDGGDRARSPAERVALQKVLGRWLTDPDLAGVRDTRGARAHGATLIDPQRPTPFERFFFRDPDGYLFEVVAAERSPEATPATAVTTMSPGPACSTIQSSAVPKPGRTTNSTRPPAGTRSGALATTATRRP